MFAIVPALEDGTPVDLAFENAVHAQRFREFMRIYVEETGPDGIRAAYWPLGLASYTCRIRAGSSRLRLVPDLLHAMLVAMHRTRYAVETVDPDEIVARPIVGSGRTGIRFEFDPDDLPPPRPPSVGDHARIVGDHHFKGDIGVVRSLLSGAVTLVPCENGIDYPMTVPAWAVIKIPCPK